MQAKVYRANIDRAKKDLMAFFNADSTDRSHWIFDYARKRPHFDKIQWHSGSMFWGHQLKVLFEDRHFHWNIGFALKQLVDEGELILMTERSQDVRKELARLPQANINRINLYRKKKRYYIRNTKKLLKLLNKWWDPVYFKGIGVHGESASELTFHRLGFKIAGRHTNEFNGIRYSQGDKNLDFILEKDNLNYGVEVKNTIGYPGYEDFKEKTFQLCDELEIIPWWISRNAPFNWNNDIKELEGFIYRNKAIIFPPISRQLRDQIWYQTGIPITLDEALPLKIQKQMERQFEKDSEIFG
ncbi:MAG: hypothetical protein ACE5OZ_23180 [Candidatus Heimdallarchaeota archaeon]